MNNKQFFSKTGLILLAAAAIILIGAISLLFRSVRIDLTQDSLYTISDGTRNILKSLEKPITISFFYSDKLTENMPQLRNYAKRVREMLEEYKLSAGGKIKLEIIDPEPFSEAEDQANEYGLQAARLAMGAPEIYFGLTGVNGDGKREVIPFFQQDREEFLEYDMTQLIYKLNRKSKNKIAVISSIDVADSINPITRQSTKGLFAITQLEEQFDVAYLQPTTEKIENDVSILLLVHPKELSEKQQYAIDQYVLGGGNLIVFVDPNSDSERYKNHRAVNTSSELDKLFQVWGLEMEKEKVIGDAGYSHVLNPGNNREPVRHLGVLGIRKESLSQDDVITKNLEIINIASVGSLKPLQGATTKFIPLVQSSKTAMLYDSDRFKFLFDPTALYSDFKPTGVAYVIAARVTGAVKSAFPGGLKAEAKDAAGKSAHLEESAHSINILVFADSDILTNDLWVRTQSFFNREIATPFADNGSFLVNAIENMQGSADLISIRSRGRFLRPFIKVDQLKRSAEDSFRQKEKELQQRLQEAEAKLADLQMQKQGENAQELSAEQQQEIKKFQEQKSKTRKDLREVQHQLNQNIEELGMLLKLVNIALVPVLLTIIALLLRVYRKRRVRAVAA